MSGILLYVTDTLYDELEPLQVLDARAAVEEGCREFLIQWPDSKPDSWVRLECPL